MANRAYAAIDVKSLDAERRTFGGIATTPAVDRVGDTIDPMGVAYRNPLPLLWQHDASKPIGTVRFDAPTKDGVRFTAELPDVQEPGTLRDRIEEAWQSIRHGLVRAVSVGFRPIDYEHDKKGIRFKQIEVFELSAVTIPANPQAVIQFGKSLDLADVEVIKQHDTAAPAAATGQRGPAVKAITPPGATGRNSTAHTKAASTMATKSIADQISAFEATRQAKSARMEALMSSAAEKGETLDAEQEAEYDDLQEQVEKIDKHLDRLRRMENLEAKTAKPVGDPRSDNAAAAVRVPAAVKQTPQVEKGIRFARVVKCLGMAQGNRGAAYELAKSIYQHDDAVVETLKAAVAAGTTGTGAWAGNLVGLTTDVYADFIEFLRPQTILGRFGQDGIPALRRVPFRTRLVGQTSGGAGYWVGEGAAKPLTRFDFSTTTLDALKVANIAVVTTEVLNRSAPAAEGIIRDQLAAALAARLDIDFINPAKTAVAGVSPASITNGATTSAAAGTGTADDVRADVRTMFGAFISQNNAPTTGVFVMSATTALRLGMLMNPIGQAEFPGIGMNGGRFQGLPVIVSEHIGNVVALVNASDIYLGDEGGISVDMSTEASLQMDDAPTANSGTGVGAAMVSLWQTNSVAFRAEREVNWARRRTGSVAYLTAVAWGNV